MVKIDSAAGLGWGRCHKRRPQRLGSNLCCVYEEPASTVDLQPLEEELPYIAMEWALSS